MTLTSPRPVALPEAKTIVRYTFFERMVHWEVGATFIYLVLSGMALAYPRMAWMMTWLGGGQTVRALHPWIGVAFTVGIVLMVFLWAKPMRFEPVDREWVRRMRSYATSGHSGLDTGRYNAGQKGYYWFIVVFGIVLFVSGVPLWFPSLFDAGSGVARASRLIHHVSYLAMLAGLIIHVYMSTVMLPGTLSGMTSGKVDRRWAIGHHPRWVREKEGAGE
jgi:formate dehydrogenase subunit gamma